MRDLIRQLEFYEMLDKKQSLKNAHERAKRRVKSYANLSADDIINIAHDEYIKKGVERLQANLEDILTRQDKIELNELTLLGMDKISAYICLLFLTVESDYDLEQEEFYSDLYVVKREKVTDIDTMMVNDVMMDDVSAVVDSVDMIKGNIDGTVEIKD